MRGDNEKSGGNTPKQNIELNVDCNIEAIRKEVSIWSQFAGFFLKWSPMNLTCFTVICGLCLAQPRDMRELCLFRKIGYRRLNSFIRKLSWREVRLLDIKLVVWCCLNLTTFYQERFRQSRGCHSVLLKRRLDGSRELFRHVIDLEIRERQNEIIQHCITYFTITLQWDFEEVVSFVFQELIISVPKKDLVLSKMIKAIELSQRHGNLHQAQLMTACVAYILENLYTDRHCYTPKLHKCFSAMLKLYLLNNLDANRSPQVKPENTKFRIQLKNSIKLFISRMRDVVGLITILDTIADIMLDSDVPNEEQSDLIDIMVHCAQKLRGRVYKEFIGVRVIFFLVSYLQSDYRASAMASQKIIQCLLDRHDNMKYFIEPIYHFKGRSDIVLNDDSFDDVNFYKQFSQEFFSAMYKCLNRYTDTVALVTSYTTVCLLLVEMPDPVITINVIYVVIKTQNKVLKDEEIYDTVTKFHIHAIVASVLSLVCLIHGDEVNALGKYVQEVVIYRNENSPHLLPPLSPEYNIAKHHTTEYHDKLYFLEHEVLCSLKQCWLGRRRTN